MLTADQKERLFEYAHDHRTSMSAVLRDIVDRIANGESTPPPATTKGDVVDQKYMASDLYPLAIERARAAGVPLYRWIATELERVLGAGK